jgi:predicted dehydrogenase
VRAEGIRVGVVGVGYWGSRHVRVLRSTTGVSDVVAVDQQFAQIGNARRRPEYGATAYPDLESALPHVDAVVIATPPGSHAPLALQAIAAGKHVLIEKPMATTAEAALTIMAAATAAGVVLMPGHTFEHNAAVHKLRELVQGGQLGRLYYLDSARLNLGLYQSDVNVIFDLAPHDISISNFVLGSLPTTVTVWGSRHVHPEHEDVAYVRLDYGELGVRSNIHVSWLDPRKVRRITAVGSKKMVVYDDMADEERIRVYDKSASPPENSDAPLSGIAYHLGEMVAPYVPFAEPLAVQDQHFVDCIANGSIPCVDGNSGLAVVQTLECAQISLREQRPVALEEVARRLSSSAAVVDATLAGTPVG